MSLTPSTNTTTTLNNNNSCACPTNASLAVVPEKSAVGSRTPLTSGPNANFLADSLGVSPLYRQQDSARWQEAAHIYQSSRAHSPLPAPPTPTMFTFNTDASASSGVQTPQRFPTGSALKKSSTSCVNSPISLEDIASANRKRHAEMAGSRLSTTQPHGGSLELEAIAAVHELGCSVKSISVSEILPRTVDLIFVNLRTHEEQPFTLELTLKGWRVASTHSDSMNGDYKRVDLHTRYFNNAKEVLEAISPGHASHFNDCLAERLKELDQNGRGTGGGGGGGRSGCKSSINRGEAQPSVG